MVEVILSPALHTTFTLGGIAHNDMRYTSALTDIDILKIRINSLRKRADSRSEISGEV
jgi:hypothetical protein